MLFRAFFQLSADGWIVNIVSTIALTLIFGAASSVFMNTMKACIVGGAVGATILVWLFAVYLLRAVEPSRDVSPARVSSEPTNNTVPSGAPPQVTGVHTAGEASPIITGSGNTVIIEGRSAPERKQRQPRRPSEQ